MSNISNVEKVAVIISSLDDLHKKKILNMLTEDERIKIQEIIKNTKNMSSHEKQDILMNFLNVVKNS